MELYNSTGTCHLHAYAPRYGVRGIGFDCELIEWLNTHTFSVESQFQDETYARKAYEILDGNILLSWRIAYQVRE
ncbi:MAG: hypothetical protein PHX08_07500 [Lachnospiraceae bacterium]|nr:hypothetical protein [Lachnospiraceae bacterium]